MHLAQVYWLAAAAPPYLLMVRRWEGSSENVILKVTLFDSSIRQHHLPIAVLNSLFPLAQVNTPISPFHLSKPLPLVVHVLPSVHVPSCPFKHANPCFQIILVLSFIIVWMRVVLVLPPFPLPLLNPALEVSLVDRPISPEVLPKPIEFPMLVVAYVNVSVWEKVSSPPVLEAAFPFSFIPIPIFPEVDPVTFSPWVPPLSYILVPFYAFPDSVPMFQALVPLSLISFLVEPGIYTLTLWPPSNVVPFIFVPIGVFLKPLSFPQVLLPIPFIHSPILVDNNSVPLSISSFVNLSHVNWVRILLHLEERARSQWLHVDEPRLWLIILHKQRAILNIIDSILHLLDPLKGRRELWPFLAFVESDRRNRIWVEVHIIKFII